LPRYLTTLAGSTKFVSKNGGNVLASKKSYLWPLNSFKDFMFDSIISTNNSIFKFEANDNIVLKKQKAVINNFFQFRSMKMSRTVAIT